MADILVFGTRAGRFASQYVKTVDKAKGIPDGILDEAINYTLSPFDENKT